MSDAHRRADTDRRDSTQRSAELEAAYRLWRRLCVQVAGASGQRMRAALLDMARTRDPAAARACLAALLAAQPEAPSLADLVAGARWLRDDAGAWAGGDQALSYRLHLEG